MPAIDAGSGRTRAFTPKKKAKKKTYTLTRSSPDQADRSRSPGQRARDRRTVNRNIARSQARARVTPDQADRSRSPMQKARDAQIVRRNVAESRQKYLGKKGRGSWKRATIKFLKSPPQFQQGTLPSTGTGPTLFVSQRKRGAGGGAGGGMQFAAMKPVIPRGVKIDKSTVVGRGLLDFANTPMGALSTAYLAGEAGKELAKKPIPGVSGSTKPAAKLIKDFDESDAPWNAAVALAKLSTGDKEGAEKRWKAAKKSANEHPGVLVLEVAGAKGVVGRGSGATVRTGAKVTKSKTLQKIGTTKRAPRKVKGRTPDGKKIETNLAEHRAYSKDLITKGGQVYRERQARKRAQKLRAQAKAETNPRRKEQLKLQARQADPDRVRVKDIQRNIDTHQAMSEDVRRLNQAEVIHGETKALKGKDGSVVGLLAQRIVRPDLKSLRGYVEELRAMQQPLREAGETAKLKANEKLVDDLDGAIERLEKGKTDISDLKAKAEGYVERSRSQQDKLAKRGIYDPEESERRAAMPFAMRELGAHRDPEYLKALEVEARKTSKKASKGAAKARNRASGQRLQHHTQSKSEAMRPQLPPSMREAAEQLVSARERQLKRSTKKSTRLTKQAQATKTEAKAAKKRAAADPLLSKDKRDLSTAQMLEAMEQVYGKGARAALVSHRPPQRAGGGDFFSSGVEPKGGETRRFEGTAMKEGAIDVSTDALMRQQVRSQTLIDHFDNYKQLIHQIALLGKDKTPKRFDTRDEAIQFADDLNGVGDYEWSIMRAAPGNKRQLEEMMRGVARPDSETDLLKNAIDQEGEGGPWVVVPRDAVKRIENHLKVLAPTNFGRGARSIGSGFSRGVLATSPGWATGNVLEAATRSAVNRVGPTSYIRGRRINAALERLDPEQAKRTRAATIGGGQAAVVDRKIHANLDAYEKGFAKTATKAAHALRGLPLAKQLTGAWDIYTHGVFGAMKVVEQQFQTAMLGKAAAEQLIPDSLRKTTSEAVEQMAQGALDPNVAVRLKREIDAMYGRYNGLSPSARYVLGQYTPFASWARNAAEFLGTLPERHPATTAALAASVPLSEDFRRENDLNYDGPGGDETLPRFLQGIPDSKGGHYRLTKFTPLGLAVDPGGTAGGLVLPSVRSALNAIQGNDWTGKPMKTSDGQPTNDVDNILTAIEAFGGPLVPFYLPTKRVVTKGPKSLLDQLTGYSPAGKPKGGGGGGGAPTGSDRFKSDRFKGDRFKSSSRFSSSRFK